MDELVKRLRELQTITEHCGEQSCDECENRELCDKFDNKTLSGTYKEAADAIEELQAQINGWIDQERKSLLKSVPRWIPVTERLPEPMKDVVLFMRYGEYKQLSEFAVGYYHDKLSDFSYCDVTHWMPLPEPPESEDA